MKGAETENEEGGMEPGGMGERERERERVRSFIERMGGGLSQG
jgi:hypothetical protein